MAPKLHDVVVKVKGGPTLDDLLRSEGFLRTVVSRYFNALDKADFWLRSDKKRGAYDGVMASLKYLMDLRAPLHVRRPLLEAAEILKKGLTLKPDELSKDAMIQIFSAVTLDLLMECEPRPALIDAAKKVAGNDLGAARALIDSRKKIKTQDLPKGSKEVFWEIKKKFLEDYPNRDEAIVRALKGVHVMRGGKP